LVLRFREFSKFQSFFKAKNLFKDRYNSLLDLVEKKTIEMPLSRLQYFGKQEHRFIYDISWSKNNPANLRDVTKYQKKHNQEPSLFDNRIHLFPNVADYLINLSGLLRPLIQRTWALEVAKINKLDESKLHNFLFSSERIGITRLTEPLRELQNDKCFYCETMFGSTNNKKPAVDHFIPWARYPNDGLANFVLAHTDCNGSKSDHIASVEHLKNWMIRNNDSNIISQLGVISDKNYWEIRKEESASIAKNFYLRLQSGVELWADKNDFKLADVDQIKSIFSSYI